MVAEKSNDQRILELKKAIEEKKKLLTKIGKFTPVTNCSLEWNGQRYNLHAISREQAVWVLVTMNSLNESAKSLGLDDQFMISGYLASQWMEDLQAKLAALQKRDEALRLAKLEKKLTDLLSTDTKTTLEINEIAELI